MPHDKNRALDIIEFIQLLRLVDDFHGQPLVLQNWQHDILWDVYGTVKDDGYRQFRYAYLEIPKKNGKTTLIAGLAVTHLTLDPPGGQIYCCAADRDQASLTYNAAKEMIDQDPDLKKMFKIVDSKKTIINRQTKTFLKVLSAEAYTKHGINPTVVIFDELHAQPNRGLWDVMTFGSGAARKEPLYWIITTAGDDPDRLSVGWEQHEYARKIRDGEITDPYWYVKLFGAAEDADIFDEKTWYDANPSLGVTINIESVRQEAIGARNDPEKERLFRWLRLNQWVSLKRFSWLPLTLWDSTEGSWGIDELVGCECFGGLDLSSKWDITAFCLLFPPCKKFKEYRAIWEFWIPEDNMRERVRKDNVPYDKWVREGYLLTTPGNVIDYPFIRARIEALSRQYKIQEIGFDEWNCLETAMNLERKLPKKSGQKQIMWPVVQGTKTMSPLMKEFEVFLKTNMFSHLKIPVMRWMFGNTCKDIDKKDNWYPIKKSYEEKIDGMIAMFDAFDREFKYRITKKKIEYREVKTI